MRLGSAVYIRPGAVGVCAMAVGLLSGQTGPPSQSAVTLRTTTTLIQVNVVAHDKNGRVIGDIRKYEFEIFDSGKPHIIATYIPERVGSGPILAARLLPPGRFTNRISADPSKQRGYAVILLDYLNTEFRNTARARRSAIKAVNQVAQGTAVGLYTLDPLGLHVRAELGSKRADVLTAIDKAIGVAAPCHQHSLDGLPDDDMTDCISTGDSPWRRYTEMATTNRINDTLNAFQAIAGHLKGLPGRKALIWATAAFPLQVDLRADGQSLFPNALGGQKLFSSEVGRAMKALNNADVTLYPVDSRALSSESPVDAPDDFTWPTINFFAERTGGKAFYGRNDMEVGILDAAGDVEVSYTLGFYVSTSGDPDGFHKLAIKTTRPGVTLLYKEGFFTEASKTPKKAEIQQSGAEALTKIMDATDIPLDASAVRKGETLTASIALRPDTQGLEFRNGRWRGTVGIAARFAKEDGRQVGNGTAWKLDFELMQATYYAALIRGMDFSRSFTVPKDAERVRLLVRSPSGRIGTLTIPLAEVK